MKTGKHGAGKYRGEIKTSDIEDLEGQVRVLAELFATGGTFDVEWLGMAEDVLLDGMRAAAQARRGNIKMADYLKATAKLAGEIGRMTENIYHAKYKNHIEDHQKLAAAYQRASENNQVPELRQWVYDNLGWCRLDWLYFMVAVTEGDNLKMALIGSEIEKEIKLLSSQKKMAEGSNV